MSDHSTMEHHWHGGLKIVESQFAEDRRQVRFPRSKRRRIRTKWTKDARNYHHEAAMFQVGQVIYVHPSLMATVRARLEAAASELQEHVAGELLGVPRFRKVYA